MHKWEQHKTNKWVCSSAYAYAYVAGVLTCLCLCYAYACAYAYALASENQPLEFGRNIFDIKIRIFIA